MIPKLKAPLTIIMISVVLGGSFTAQAEKDIRKFTQHFIETGEKISPWRFIPEDNIKSLSTTEAPGFAVIRHEGKGKDIKGILEEPIKFDDYPPPWEFHMGVYQEKFAAVGSEKQVNYAFGVNVAVTFSDPSTWPEDRTQTPPDTHSVQLFVVHLGNVGENYRPGAPLARQSALNSYDNSPEVFLVYGRGDLSPEVVNGNWNMNYTALGTDPNDAGGGEIGGPADPVVKFRVGVSSRGSLTIGVGFGSYIGWKHRTVNFSPYGNATGIWEIGPIISLDNWMAEELASELGLNEPPTWLKSIKARYGTDWDDHDPATIDALLDLFKFDPPNPDVPYYLDYAWFYGSGPERIEHLSEDFNIPGFQGGEKYLIEGNVICETYSNPGYLTATTYGNHGGWAMCPVLNANGPDLSKNKKPPFEIEIAFRSPDNDKPWNLWWNVGLYNKEEKLYVGWQPGIKNIPGVGCKYSNSFMLDADEWEYPQEYQNSAVNPRFEPEIPELLGHKPLYWVLQVLDDHRVRVGVRGDPADPWTFSTVSSTKDIFETKGGSPPLMNKSAEGPAFINPEKPFGSISKFGYPALVSYQIKPKEGKMGVGNYPGYQKFLIDYIHYRYSLSE